METFPGERINPVGASIQLEQARAHERDLLQKRNKLLGLQDAPVVAAPDDEAPTQKVRLVAHDLTARPGVTYHYALVVNMVNPLFHELGLSAAQQATEYQRLALASQLPSPPTK